MRALKKELVSRLAYLMGVREDILNRRYGEECGEILEQMRDNKSARTVRILNTIRSTMMMKYQNINNAIIYELKNIDRIEYFNKEDIAWLEGNGIKLLSANTTLDKYIIKVNQLINAHINECKALIPEWVTWEYIKDLFVIPGTSNTNSEAVSRAIKEEYKTYTHNINLYPFQQYIHWQPIECGNMLANDKKFMIILHQEHNSIFCDNGKVMDANEEIKDNIYNFIDENESTAIIVDCENSNVYKLYSVLKNLNKDELSKVKKIILYDDYHTNKIWTLLEKLVNIKTERIEVERVTDAKSLVDIKMTAGVCRAFYEEGIKSFILVSSDSDFWGLISSLPSAEFLVMIEYDKCGRSIKKVLRENNIYYCSIDDFCMGNIEEIKNLALKTALQESLETFNTMGIWEQMEADEFVNSLYELCRIEPTAAERKRFVEKYIKNIVFSIDVSGKFGLKIK